MKRMAFGWFSSSFITAFSRSSKSPRYRVPASSAPMSSEKIVVSASTAGVSPSTILRASPSAMAVLPTPGSPTSSGLFLRRRQRTWMHRSTSRSRPISGSTSPRRAFSFRSTQYFCNAVSSASLAPWDLCLRLGRCLRALHRPRLAVGRILGDAVADVVHRVVAGHVLLLQEIRGMALAFREDRDEHVRAGHLASARSSARGSPPAGSPAGSRWSAPPRTPRCRRSARRAPRRGRRRWSCAACRCRRRRPSSPARRRARRPVPEGGAPASPARACADWPARERCGLRLPGYSRKRALSASFRSELAGYGGPARAMD